MFCYDEHCNATLLFCSINKSSEGLTNDRIQVNLPRQKLVMLEAVSYHRTGDVRVSGSI